MCLALRGVRMCVGGWGVCVREGGRANTKLDGGGGEGGATCYMDGMGCCCDGE